jgi:hypothetical protein
MPNSDALDRKMRGDGGTIEGFLAQLLAVEQDLPGVADGSSPAQFNWHRAPERWSIGQCVEHLNITTERYIPVLAG